MSPAIRGRGLKLGPYQFNLVSSWSPAIRGRGLKLYLLPLFSDTYSSPAIRGRGLKQSQYWYRLHQTVSPAIRGRGLKHLLIVAIYPSIYVARHTRAWIETAICLRTGQQSSRRPPYAGVD